jgi:hypothetical protein
MPSSVVFEPILNGCSTNINSKVTCNFNGVSVHKVKLSGPEHKRRWMIVFQDN